MARPRRQAPGVPVPPRPARLLPLLLCLGLGLALSGTAADAKEKLVPANTSQLHRTDSKGFNWDPNSNGVIRDGTNDCFDDAIRLKVNQTHFQPTKPILQTKDGQEFVFEGQIGTIGVVRRLKIHSQTGAVRVVELLTNRSKRRVKMPIELYSMLGSNAQRAVTNLGRAVATGPLQKGETSLFATNPQNGRPSVIFHLRGPSTQVTPVVNVSNTRTFTITYSLDIPPGKTVAIMHGLAQRRFPVPPSPKVMAEELKPFLDASWTQGLPSSVRSAIVNQETSAASAEGLTKATPAHQEVMRLAKAYEVKRDENATVFIERGKPLQGSATGAPLKVVTRMGAVEVPFDDVAVIRGGAGVGRSMRLFLRDGEILAGEIAAPDLIFKTSSGLDIPLTPEGIDALFLPKAERDGAVADGTEAFLTQLDGTKLSLQASEGVNLAAVSPWGDMAIPLDAVVRVRHARDPLPGLWILLRDGSRFPLAVRGDAWKLTSRRFGSVDVAPGSIAAWSRHGVAAALEKNEEDEVVPVLTHAQLVGGCFLVGEFADKTLTIETVAGATPVDVTTIRSIARSDDVDGPGPAFAIKLMTGEALLGRIAEPLVRFKTPRGACRVPLLHLWAYRWAPPPKPPEPPEPPKEEAPKDEAPKDEAPKDEAPKDEPAKEEAPKDAPAKAEPAKKGNR